MSQLSKQLAAYIVVGDDGTCSNVDTIDIAVGTLSQAGTAFTYQDTICFGNSTDLILQGSNGAVQWQSFDGTNWINEILKDKERLAVSINQKGKSDIKSLTEVLAQLLSHGISLDLSMLYPAEEKKAQLRQFLKKIIPGGKRIFDVIG